MPLEHYISTLAYIQFVCMYVYICINFHDKIIVCAGSVDLKGIKNKSKKETKKLTIVW